MMDINDVAVHLFTLSDPSLKWTYIEDVCSLIRCYGGVKKFSATLKQVNHGQAIGYAVFEKCETSLVLSPGPSPN